MDDRDRLQAVAVAAADEVSSGMTVGLGSGSTAEAFIRELGRRVQYGLAITGVPTSDHSAAVATDLGIPLTGLDDAGRLDVGVDGADEIDPALDLVKGRGGALLHEKLVALACDRYVIIAASEKLITRLGTRMPLPVEVIPFGWRLTARRLAAIGLDATPRMIGDGDSDFFVSDGGHYILDCVAGQSIARLADLALPIKVIPGVVDHGLFTGMADRVIVVDAMGTVRKLDRSLAPEQR